MNIEDFDISKFTPMMQQYLQIKKDYTDVIVFFRLGDFYEMFFNDAVVASRELEIQLTGRDAGQERKVPMCGIPFHAYETYATRLVEKGYKIAIVEQVEDPKSTKGIVKRDVIKILTPGTYVSTNLEKKENNYIASIKSSNKSFVLSYMDVTTGDSYLTILDSESELINEIVNLRIKEVVVGPVYNKKVTEMLSKSYGIVISNEEKKAFGQKVNELKNDCLIDKQTIDLSIFQNYDINHKKEILYYLLSEFYQDDLILVNDKHIDCGCMVFNESENSAGASGPACVMCVSFSYVINKMLKGKYNKVLIIGTGALHSAISYQQKENIPSIAHAIVLEVNK